MYLNKLLILKKLQQGNTHLGFKIGTKNSKWSRFSAQRAQSYIFGFRASKPIIDLEKTVISLRRACNVIQLIIRSNGHLLLINTNPKYNKIIQQTAKRTNQSYINHKWIGGFLTNWNHMQNVQKQFHAALRFSKGTTAENQSFSVPRLGSVNTGRSEEQTLVPRDSRPSDYGLSRGANHAPSGLQATLGTRMGSRREGRAPYGVLSILRIPPCSGPQMGLPERGTPTGSFGRVQRSTNAEKQAMPSKPGGSSHGKEISQSARLPSQFQKDLGSQQRPSGETGVSPLSALRNIDQKRSVPWLGASHLPVPSVPLLAIDKRELGCFAPGTVDASPRTPVGAFPRYKKMQKCFEGTVSRENKLSSAFSPLTNSSAPDCVVIFNASQGSEGCFSIAAIYEAHSNQIPIISVVDSNISNELYNLVTYPIPANCDSVQFIYLFCNCIFKTILLSR